MVVLSCLTLRSPTRNLRGNAKSEVTAQAVVIGHKWPSISAACKMVHTPYSVMIERLKVDQIDPPAKFQTWLDKCSCLCAIQQGDCRRVPRPPGLQLFTWSSIAAVHMEMQSKAACRAQHAKVVLSPAWQGAGIAPGIARGW